MQSLRFGMGASAQLRVDPFQTTALASSIKSRFSTMMTVNRVALAAGSAEIDVDSLNADGTVSASLNRDDARAEGKTLDEYHWIQPSFRFFHTPGNTDRIQTTLKSLRFEGAIHETPPDDMLDTILAQADLIHLWTFRNIA